MATRWWASWSGLVWAAPTAGAAPAGVGVGWAVFFG